MIKKIVIASLILFFALAFSVLTMKDESQIIYTIPVLALPYFAFVIYLVVKNSKDDFKPVEDSAVFTRQLSTVLNNAKRISSVPLFFLVMKENW